MVMDRLTGSTTQNQMTCNYQNKIIAILYSYERYNQKCKKIKKHSYRRIFKYQRGNLVDKILQLWWINAIIRKTSFHILNSSLFNNYNFKNYRNIYVLNTYLTSTGLAKTSIAGCSTAHAVISLNRTQKLLHK